MAFLFFCYVCLSEMVFFYMPAPTLEICNIVILTSVSACYVIFVLYIKCVGRIGTWLNY